MLDNSLSVNGFLGQETSSGKHSKTSVLEFLGLHFKEFLRVLGLQSKGIKLKISWGVVIPQKSSLVDGAVGGVNPSGFSTECLSTSNEGDDNRPESIRDLGDVGDSGSTDLGVEKEGASLNFLTDKETDDGKHSNTAVGELSLTVTGKSGISCLLSKSQRIEKSNRGEGTRKTFGRSLFYRYRIFSFSYVSEICNIQQMLLFSLFFLSTRLLIFIISLISLKNV